MPSLRLDHGFIKLQRVQRVKQFSPPSIGKLGEEVAAFFTKSVQKRKTKLEKIAQVWSVLVSETSSEHCSLESLNRGLLTVIVDSSSHLYDLKQELLGGVEKNLILACKSTGLRKVVLKPGRWYDGDTEKRVKFD